MTYQYYYFCFLFFDALRGAEREAFPAVQAWSGNNRERLTCTAELCRTVLFAQPISSWSTRTSVDVEHDATSWPSLAATSSAASTIVVAIAAPRPWRWTAGQRCESINFRVRARSATRVDRRVTSTWLGPRYACRPGDAMFAVATLPVAQCPRVWVTFLVTADCANHSPQHSNTHLSSTTHGTTAAGRAGTTM